MQCIKCGKENPETQKYCMNCGNVLENESLEEKYERRHKKRGIKPKTILVIMLILLPLLLLLMFLLLLFFLGINA